MDKLLILIGSVLISYQVGYVAAHMEITLECKRLGGFYVGEQVYKCAPVEQLKQIFNKGYQNE